MSLIERSDETAFKRAVSAGSSTVYIGIMPSVESSPINCISFSLNVNFLEQEQKAVIQTITTAILFKSIFNIFIE